MEKITFINSKGRSLELGNDGPFILTKIEGTGAVNVNIQSQKSPFQDGETYLGNTLEPRSIPIEITLLGENETDIADKRSKLLQIFNPKLGQGRLIYEFGNIKREIKAIPELAPVFPHAGDFSDTMQPGLIQFYCSNPFWIDEFETSEEIVTWIGGMRFPLRLPTRFAMKGPKKINIINNGDVETPVRIEFKGPATNPKIINHTTGEYIKVNRILTSEDLLIITTEFGNKRVEINGQNVFNWIDLNSAFWQLEVGDNIIEYTSDDEVESASVKIVYRNRFIGV